MSKKLLIASFGLILLLAMSLTATAGEKPRATAIPEGQIFKIPAPEGAKDACALNKAGAASYYFSGFVLDDANVTFYNPVTCGFTPTYPFEITGFSFTLYNDGSMVWPVVMDVVVYDMAVAGDSCAGPGAELCRMTVTCDAATFGYPTYGTVAFATPCCVNGPFYAGVQYKDPGAGPFPSVLYDAATPDTCDNWFFYQGAWTEWYNAWTQPGPGYPLFIVYGETNSPNCKQCDWKPGDPHKMHFPQLPDEAGWDVNATQPLVLAEDWMCSETGWIKDFHFWGSWKHGIEGQIMYFVLSIHANIPADPPAIPYSRPGPALWELYVEDFNAKPIDPATMEGWYDPSTGETIPNDHQAYFQYNICPDSINWFWQDSGQVYWLNISAVVADPVGTQWGWKSTQDHWNDDAVWAYWGSLDWIDIWEPYTCDTLSNPFYIEIDPSGNFINGGGGGAFGQGWYYYPETDWWNIWFYDHPFRYDRYKTVRLEFDVFPMIDGLPAFFEIAVDWSTDFWSNEQPPGDSAPPLPGVDEMRYIGRQTLFSGYTFGGHYVFYYEVLDYNPEWVSVDVRGYNFVIPGGVEFHACCPRQQQSLDLSFVITGGAPPVDTGACCYPDPTGLGSTLCTVTTQADCINNLGGTYMGNNTQCAGMQACCLTNGSCVNADSLCCVDLLGGIPQGPGTVCTALEACCFTDGSCLNLDPLCCIEQGGVPQGPGTVCTTPEACCLTDGSCINVDPLCCDEMGGVPQGAGTLCTAPQGCCMPDGSCRNLDPVCCDDQGGVPQGAGTLCTAPKACCMPGGGCTLYDPLCCDEMGGTPSPIGSPICLGDGNSNGVDDACEGGWQPGDPHKMHYPQLPDESGWDVNATYPLVLADDWRCSEAGPVKDFHFWGSWKNGIVGHISYFILSIHSDIPADQSPTGYSMPGPALWELDVADFGAVAIDPTTLEGWYDPSTGETIPNDHNQYFQYNILLQDSLTWFYQKYDSIYWLNITAVVDPMTPATWGWKSSVNHWNDDAVWAFWGDYNWLELYEPYVPRPITNGYNVTIDQAGMLIAGAGENAYGEGWYYYPQYDWWNIWFYDHPFRTDRYKTIQIEFDVFPFEPGPGYFEIAVNWSTDLWSIEQPPGDSAPPLPGVDEDRYIGRETLMATEFYEGHYVFTYVIEDYNPEWVSIDVRGFNFQIPGGIIVHECVGQQSMDMAFVITGGVKCDCIPGDANGNTIINILDITYLINYVYKGGPAPIPYALCSGDPNCNCVINILDITYLISYLYKGGPPPCTCQQWLAACGPPLRK
jgi:hypothetical protein